MLAKQLHRSAAFATIRTLAVGPCANPAHNWPMEMDSGSQQRNIYWDLSFSNILLFQPEVQEHLYDPLNAFDARSLSPWGSTESSRMPEFVLLGLFGPSADS
jgi:hypothetical protein